MVRNIFFFFDRTKKKKNPFIVKPTLVRLLLMISSYEVCLIAPLYRVGSQWIVLFSIAMSPWFTVTSHS